MCLLVVAAVLSGSCAAQRELRAGGGSAPQDAETGIMRGAEPILLVGEGRRRACLLLHGWLTTPADFGDLPQALDAAGWDVYAPLHRGHGTHPRDLEGITADAIMETARGHCEALRARYDTVALVGFSIGGAVATLLAEEAAPDRLVLVAPYFGLRHHWYYVLPARFWHQVLSPVVPYIKRGRSLLRIRRKEGLARLVTYTVFPTRASDAAFELSRRVSEDCDVSRLAMPALLVYAPGDFVCSPQAELDFFARLPGEGNQTLSCDNSDHHILNDYGRQEAIQAITAFLRGE